MGTWGYKPLENDEAADLAAEYEEKKDIRILENALKAVSELSESEYLEAPESQMAIAAASIVAKPQAIQGEDKRRLELLAKKAVKRILEKSELEELWRESDEYDKWTEETKRETAFDHLQSQLPNQVDDSAQKQPHDPPKRPRGIMLLYVFIAWSIYNTVSLFILSDNFTDKAIFAHYGLEWLMLVYILLDIVLSILSLYALYSRSSKGRRYLYGLFGLGILGTVVTATLGLMSPGLIESTYRISRESRGLHTDGIDIITSVPVVLLSMVLYIVFYLVLLRYVRKQNDYFCNQ